MSMGSFSSGQYQFNDSLKFRRPKKEELSYVVGALMPDYFVALVLQ